MQFYLDERQRQKQSRIFKLKIYTGFTLFFFLIIGALYLIIYSSLFQIKNIEITGNKNVKTEEIINGAKKVVSEQSKLASFLTTNNILIWKIEPDLFQKAIPQIEKLTIEKDYFNRQIKINVQERQKFGVWCMAPDSSVASSTPTQQLSLEECFWFDNQGTIFSGAPSVEGGLINKVDDFSGRSLKFGETVLAEKFLPNLFKIFEILRKSDLGINSLKLEKLELQEISTESSPQIYFSLRIDPGFGLAAIESLKNIGLDKIEYIDLRIENRAYYKMK